MEGFSKTVDGFSFGKANGIDRRLMICQSLIAECAAASGEQDNHAESAGSLCPFYCAADGAAFTGGRVSLLIAMR